MLEKNILITGQPGIGKTTLIMKLADELRDLEPSGFYTEEIREGGIRKGFKLVDFSGKEGILAHVKVRSPHRVSKYRVDVEGFEEMISSMNFLASSSSVMLIDEIGKMECFSMLFIDTMRELLDSDKVIVASISARGGGFIKEVKGRSDCECIEVRSDNRDLLAREVAEKVKKRLV